MGRPTSPPPGPFPMGLARFVASELADDVISGQNTKTIEGYTVVILKLLAQAAPSEKNPPNHYVTVVAETAKADNDDSIMRSA